MLHFYLRYLVNLVVSGLYMWKMESWILKKGAVTSPTTTLEMEDKDFLDMMNGKLPAMQAYTSGKLKISGDIMKSQLIEKLFKLN